MKLLFLNAIFFCFCFNAIAQASAVDSLGAKKKNMQWKYFEAEYPIKAREAGIQGTVTIMFDIDSTCGIVNRRVLKGIGGGCDEAALKVLDKTEIDLRKRYSAKCNQVKDISFPAKFLLK